MTLEYRVIAWDDGDEDGDVVWLGDSPNRAAAALAVDAAGYEHWEMHVREIGDWKPVEKQHEEEN